MNNIWPCILILFAASSDMIVTGIPNMLKFRTTLLVMVIACSVALGQSTGRMETDRPDQAECADVVRSGYIQAELGFNANRYPSMQEWDIPTSLIKYGIADRLELRYISVLEAVNGKLTYQPDAAGMKVSLFEGKRWIPKTSLIGQYHFNDDKRDNSDYNRRHHSIGELVFTFQNDVSETFGVGYNLGPEFHSDGSAELIYRITPGWNLGPSTFFYAEIFGRRAKSESETWADAGLAQYLSDDLKIDISAGLNLQGEQKYYAAIGISFRFKILNTTDRVKDSGNITSNANPHSRNRRN